MFDHTEYRSMRKQLGCEGVFPDVYDKVGPRWLYCGLMLTPCGRRARPRAGRQFKGW